MPCSNAAKTRNPLKFAGVPKLPNGSQPLVGRSSPYCENMWGRYCCLTMFPIVNTCLRWEDIAQQSCAVQWRNQGFRRPGAEAVKCAPLKVVTWVWRQQSVFWSNVPLRLCQADNYPAILWFSFNSMLTRKAVVGITYKPTTDVRYYAIVIA